MSLDLRHSNRDLLLRSAAATVGRMSGRSVNFPRVERSPSRCSESSVILDDGHGHFNGFNGVGETPNGNGFMSSDIDLVQQAAMAMPLPSIPAALRTSLYRNRRTLLD
jgi:hypothetical protein